MSPKTNIKRTLGATHPVGASQVVFFVPNRDREDKPINQQHWVDETLNVMGKIFRGATAFPPGRGVWRDDEAGGRLLKEQTVMVVSYIDRKLLTGPVLRSLREFLHRFGREAQQGEVGVVIDSKYYGISRYDNPQA
ncbi:MAG TPA: hypothetical protein DCZ05_01490 [Deltaproteobacteria bacterium]|nr:MAG: hypothetical protein A2X89_07800 [Deltaproteobacteria bacterium GWD2_55_8]HBA38445.1 hypothetical protein [Deltaproteobacteria bacterium]